MNYILLTKIRHHYPKNTMPFEFTEDEWKEFSKTERRLITLARQLGYEKPQIKASLEIVDSTYRVHIAHIKRKMAIMRKRRSEAEMKVMADKVIERNKLYGDSPDGARPLDDIDGKQQSEQQSSEQPTNLLNVSQPN